MNLLNSLAYFSNCVESKDIEQEFAHGKLFQIQGQLIIKFKLKKLNFKILE
jgi:hypothetical protein